MSCCEVNIPLGDIAEAIVNCYGKQMASCLPQPVTDVKLLPSSRELSVTKNGKTELYPIDVNDEPGRGIGFDVVYKKVFTDDMTADKDIVVANIAAEKGDVVIAKVSFDGNLGQSADGAAVYRFAHSRIKEKEQLIPPTSYPINAAFGAFGVIFTKSFFYIFKSNGSEDLVLKGNGQIEGDVTVSYTYLPVGDE